MEEGFEDEIEDVHFDDEMEMMEDMYQDKNVDDDNSECEEFRNDGTNNKYKRPAISLN
jgi:hypothetical protein